MALYQGTTLQAAEKRCAGQESNASGPKGQRVCLIDVRAKARTYPTASFSEACLAVP
jgi:hypothetical protein